jgi:hypothetical protein
MGDANVVLPEEDPDNERLVPTAWRATFEAVVEAFVRGDFQPQLPQVDPVSESTAEHARSYVADYGEILVELTQETWETSVALWMGEQRWEVLVDLRTESEGRSDLVLHAFVTSAGEDHRVQIYMVYVP